MKKKMTKRLLALVLALALCTALMLPGFAETITSDASDMCVDGNTRDAIYISGMCNDGKGHVIVISEQSTFSYQNGPREVGFHVLYRCRVYTCQKCGQTSKTILQERKESHQVPCSVCDFQHS